MRNKRRVCKTDGERRAYNSWRAMMSRCHYHSTKSFRWYGAKGIKVCDRWLKFQNFLEDMGERPEGEWSLDRIDNNGNYEPTNCRWLPLRDQTNNTDSVTMVEFNGQIMNIHRWAKHLHMPVETIRDRLAKGWPVDLALSTQRYAGQHGILAQALAGGEGK